MKDYDPLSDVIRHLEGHECETVYIDKAKGVRQIVELSRRGFDVFINLCDGAWDEDRAGIEIVQTLERWTSPSPAQPQFLRAVARSDEEGLPLLGHKGAGLRGGS
jgi:D-alanine-D-alanine ligase